jgi:hypothetical protein
MLLELPRTLFPLAPVPIPAEQIKRINRFYIMERPGFPLGLGRVLGCHYGAQTALGLLLMHTAFCQPSWWSPGRVVMGTLLQCLWLWSTSHLITRGCHWPDGLCFCSALLPCYDRATACRTSGGQLQAGCIAWKFTQYLHRTSLTFSVDWLFQGYCNCHFCSF